MLSKLNINIIVNTGVINNKLNIPVKNDTLKFKTPRILLNITSFDLMTVSFKSMLFVDKKSDNLVCIAVWFSIK